MISANGHTSQFINEANEAVQHAERAVVGGLAFDLSGIDRHQPDFQWFADPLCQAVFIAVRAYKIQHRTATQCSPSALIQFVSQTPELTRLFSDQVGGVDEITSVIGNGYHDAALLEGNLSTVREAFQRRERREVLARLEGLPNDRFQRELLAFAERLRLESQEESKVEFDLIDSSAFVAADYRATFYVKKILVAGQNMIIGGAQKAMKTSIAEELAISLGSKSPFLGTFEVPAVVPCGILSGESGGFTLQETALRIAAAKGISLKQCAVHWGFKLPQLGLSSHLDALCKAIEKYGIKVVLIDPAYLCMLHDDNHRQIEFKNLFSMGGIFDKVSRWFATTSCTPILLHHESKGSQSVRRFEPMQLADLSMSGFAEWARQWILLSRRSPYEAGTGHHELWANVGGSCGHGGLWSVDIDEGVVGDDFGGRVWNVSVNTASQERAARASASEEKKSARQRERDDADRGKLLKVYREDYPKGETATQLRGAAGLSGERFTFINVRLIEEGLVEPFTVTKAGLKRDAFRLKPSGKLFHEGANHV